jgi:hypothetical protein
VFFFAHMERRDIWMMVVFASEGVLLSFLERGSVATAGAVAFFVARRSDSPGFLTGVQRF